MYQAIAMINMQFVKESKEGEMIRILVNLLECSLMVLLNRMEKGG